MNNKCIYYVEDPCEQRLITALKEQPAKLIPKPKNLWETKKLMEFSFVESNSDSVKI